jgi:hypothetical protein
MPSVSWQLAEPVGAGPQVPSVAPPSAMLHTPPQQSVGFAHTSPSWPQNEDALHLPALHSPEQQSALPAQVLPSVLQVVLSGTQVPPVQLPLQQSLLEVHACLSAVHSPRLQTPLVHVPEQQSAADVHAAPRLEQSPPSLPPLPPAPMPLVLELELELPPPAPPVPELVLVTFVPLPQPAADAAAATGVANSSNKANRVAVRMKEDCRG